MTFGMSIGAGSISVGCILVQKAEIKWLWEVFVLEGETPDILTLFHRPANLVSRSLIQNEQT